MACTNSRQESGLSATTGARCDQHMLDLCLQPPSPNSVAHAREPQIRRGKSELENSESKKPTKKSHNWSFKKIRLHQDQHDDCPTNTVTFPSPMRNYGESKIAEPYRRERIHQNMGNNWS